MAWGCKRDVIQLFDAQDQNPNLHTAFIISLSCLLFLLFSVAFPCSVGFIHMPRFLPHFVDYRLVFLFLQYVHYQPFL